MLLDKNIDVGDVSEGIAIIKHRLCNKKVLLVLDDVDKQDQLQKLAGDRNWFGPGSKIIITTRDKRLLTARGIDSIYQIEELDDQESLELFCWNAFKRREPNAGYEDISMCAIHQAKNLTLVLEIIGSNLYGKQIDEWEYTLDKYENIPNKEIHNILRISYDSLDYTEKQIFLDIACFFKGMSFESCKEVLSACNFYPDYGKLFFKNHHYSLANAVDYGSMQDALQVLTEDTGSDKIEGIMLQLPNEEKVYWNGEAFEKMKNLRILMVENAYFSPHPKHLPNSLRVLDWKNYPALTLPMDFHPEKLVVLNLPDSRFKFQESFRFKKYEFLIYMDFSYCISLKEVPDMSGIPNLVELHLDHCSNLVKVHDSVGFLNKLVKFSAKYCYSLYSFPPSIHSTALEYLNLRKCFLLVKFPNILEKMKKIRFIDVGGTEIEELPSSFKNLVGIEALHMVQCSNLRVLPSGFLMLQNLKELDMRGCPNIRKSFGTFKGDDQVDPSALEFNESSNILHLVSLNVQECDLLDEDVLIILSCFPKLEKLNLAENKFEILPECIKELIYLESLELNSCFNLKEITKVPPHLQYISAMGCLSLTTESSNVLLNQGLNEIQNLTILADRDEIPEWFDHRSEGGSLSFLVRTKFPVIALCAVLGAMSIFFQLQLSLLVNGIKVYGFEATFSVKSVETIWMHDLRAHISPQQWKNLDTYLRNDWNLVEVSFTMSTGTVNWCGVHVYKKETNMEDVLFTIPDLPNIFNETIVEPMENPQVTTYGNTSMQQQQDSTLIKPQDQNWTKSYSYRNMVGFSGRQQNHDTSIDGI
ncbi:Disease resistance protein [Quillaja saponaria]|nr:Disease resistance protein [Quillaja saponaria]